MKSLFLLLLSATAVLSAPAAEPLVAREAAVEAPALQVRASTADVSTLLQNAQDLIAQLNEAQNSAGSLEKRQGLLGAIFGSVTSLVGGLSDIVSSSLDTTTTGITSSVGTLLSGLLGAIFGSGDDAKIKRDSTGALSIAFQLNSLGAQLRAAAQEGLSVDASLEKRQGLLTNLLPVLTTTINAATTFVNALLGASLKRDLSSVASSQITELKANLDALDSVVAEIQAAIGSDATLEKRQFLLNLIGSLGDLLGSTLGSLTGVLTGLLGG